MYTQDGTLFIMGDVYLYKGERDGEICLEHKQSKERAWYPEESVTSQ